jgi:hypothetical protein
VLTNAVWDADRKSAELDFSSALAMNLDEALADRAIPNVETLVRAHLSVRGRQQRQRPNLGVQHERWACAE